MRATLQRVGSLIVIERSTGLRSYAESGVMVNADISEEFIGKEVDDVEKEIDIKKKAE